MGEHIQSLHGKLASNANDVETETLMSELVQRSLSVYDDEALSLVEDVLLGKHRSLTATTREAAPSRKRGRDSDTDPILRAAAAWGTSNFKRLRTAKTWSSTAPKTFVAIVGGQIPAELQDEMECGVAIWAKQAQLSALLEVLRDLGPSVDRNIFDLLLQSVQLKMASLEEQNASLGGEGLREAQEQAASAKAAAEAASSLVEEAESRARKAEAEALALQRELADERRSHDVLEVAIKEGIDAAFAKASLVRRPPYG